MDYSEFKRQLEEMEAFYAKILCHYEEYHKISLLLLKGSFGDANVTLKDGSTVEKTVLQNRSVKLKNKIDDWKHEKSKLSLTKSILSKIETKENLSSLELRLLSCAKTWEKDKEKYINVLEEYKQELYLQSEDLAAWICQGETVNNNKCYGNSSSMKCYKSSLKSNVARIEEITDICNACEELGNFSYLYTYASTFSRNNVGPFFETEIAKPSIDIDVVFISAISISVACVVVMTVMYVYNGFIAHNYPCEDFLAEKLTHYMKNVAACDCRQHEVDSGRFDVYSNITI